MRDASVSLIDTRGDNERESSENDIVGQAGPPEEAKE